MVNALLSVIRRLRSAWLFEAVGAGLIVYGLYLAWGTAQALVGAGVAVLAKSAELDQRGDE